MGQPLDIRTAYQHHLLRHHCLSAQLCRHPIHRAQALPHRGIHEEACLHHHGHHDSNLRHHPGYYAGHRRAELLYHGRQSAGDLCMAIRGYPLLAAIARQGRPDQECLPHLHPTDSSRIPGHCVRHHPDSQRACQHHVSTGAAGLRPVAVERHRPSQPEHPAVGHVLHLYLAGGIHCVRRLLMGWLYPVGRAGADMVDHAADLRTDHYLHQPVPEAVWSEAPFRGQARHQDMGLRHDVPGDTSLHECGQRHAEHLVGG